MEEHLGNWIIHTINGRQANQKDLIDIGECIGHCDRHIHRFVYAPHFIFGKIYNLSLWFSHWETKLESHEQMGCTGSVFRTVEMYKKDKQLFVDNFLVDACSCRKFSICWKSDFRRFLHFILILHIITAFLYWLFELKVK